MLLGIASGDSERGRIRWEGRGNDLGKGRRGRIRLNQGRALLGKREDVKGIGRGRRGKGIQLAIRR